MLQILSLLVKRYYITRFRNGGHFGIGDPGSENARQRLLAARLLKMVKKDTTTALGLNRLRYD
jgi:hypothetical protein